ncbi:alpha/beta hydrolase [Streptomyces durmitorensis]|uniref:Alpha/beta hydrolase n=1 Tax=Streptomyces durmitorensis TaxID=319947 RepID=A0ABY4PY87_9ACTN|nr:alpha/beta hydrolase [Streptomyces durmitorensis]UQT58144.1 alpha/beta hydrolase [Streptomyces durmitorensis]
MSSADPALRALIAAPHPDVAPLPPAARPAPDLRLLRGVPYGEVEGGRPLELDLWLPDTVDGPLPLVLFVHGGAWRRGRRDDMGMATRHWDPGPLARIAAAGFAVACADYRLSGEARFPAPLDDLRAALRWLELRSPELGVDPARTVVWGESAGGHLASLLALDPAVPAAGAVIWYAPSDLTVPRGPFDPHSATTPEALLLGAAPATVPERARAASPVTRVHRAAPPFLLVHGERDTMVPATHSEALAAGLRDAGAARVELRTVPGADHGWHGLPDADVEDVFAHSLRFARELVD